MKARSKRARSEEREFLDRAVLAIVSNLNWHSDRMDDDARAAWDFAETLWKERQERVARQVHES